MGRVDEAMRRAAEAAAGTTGTEAEAQDLHLLSVVKELRPDAFPAEAPETPRRLRNVKVDTPGSAVPMFPPLADRMLSTLSRKVVIDHDIDPVSREQYRRLATGLHAGQVASGLKVIAVASALASEGKSLTASNLGLTLSESYQRSVLLIDGDLRRPSLERIFGLPPGSGLSDSVLASGEQRLNLHQVSQHLTVLAAGRPTGDPMATLASARMRQLVDEARATFDWVIIDTPPIGLLSDASLLADIADGTLLVVKAEATPYDVVQQAVSALGKDRILGVVLNQASESGPAEKYHSYYHVADSPKV
jgi:capsular exopolysaccharide synthesis family protein